MKTKEIILLTSQSNIDLAMRNSSKMDHFIKIWVGGGFLKLTSKNSLKVNLYYH